MTGESAGSRKQAVSPVISVLPPKGAAKPAAKPDDAQKQMKDLLATARKLAKGSGESWGQCYGYVYSKYMLTSGYGKIGHGHDPIPAAYGEVAAQFAEYANSHLDELGLTRLNIDSPYDAPAGAVVVVAAGSPGTSSNESHWGKHPSWKKHPTWPGDISVVSGDGVHFYNDHLDEKYGGKDAWAKAHKAGTAKLLGAYVPR